ncbi:MAG: extracellular matrix/biofilm biosynthesis regulator RemA family protein, partial [Dehalococcoidia bacterium]
MAVDLLHVGFSNFVPAARVVAVLSPEAAPVRRLIQQGKADGRTIDMTKG